MRLGAQRDGLHFLGSGHFQVERNADFGGEILYVAVSDMAAIFTQMRCDGIGASLCRDQRRPQWIGIRRTARIAHRGDVIDVDA
jgi:hypothetical protein